MGANAIWLGSLQKGGNLDKDMHVMRHREKTAIYQPSGKAGKRSFPHTFRRNQPCWHLDCRRLVYRTVRKSTSLCFQPPSLWYFVTAALRIRHRPYRIWLVITAICMHHLPPSRCCLNTWWLLLILKQCSYILTSPHAKGQIITCDIEFKNWERYFKGEGEGGMNWEIGIGI